MKITGFRPIIITKDAGSAVKLFEELGFETRHSKKAIEDGSYDSFILRNGDANRLVVLASKTIPRDLTGVSISVDDFQAAYDLLLAHGFVNSRGADRVTETGSSRSALLLSPTGYAVMLTQHVKSARP